MYIWDFPGGRVDKNSPANAGDTGLVPGPGFPDGSVVKNPPAHRTLGKCRLGGNGNPLQYSCLKSPIDRGAWQATVHGVTKNQI